jgi:hypothetical protein
LTQVHAFIHRREPGPDDLDFARRLVYDNIPTLRLRVLPYLSTEKTTTVAISEASGVGTDVVRYTLEDLVTLGVCKKTSRDNKGEGDKRYDDYWLTNSSYAEFIEEVVKPVNSYKRGLFGTFLNDPGTLTNNIEPEQRRLIDRGMQPACTHTNVFLEHKKLGPLGGSLHASHDYACESPLHTDDDFLRAFRAKVGSYKIAGTQQLKPQTRETLPDFICKEVAGEHAIHLDDVRARWDAVCDDREIQRYMDEIFKDSEGASPGVENEEETEDGSQSASATAYGPPDYVRSLVLERLRLTVHNSTRAYNADELMAQTAKDVHADHPEIDPSDIAAAFRDVLGSDEGLRLANESLRSSQSAADVLQRDAGDTSK